MGPVSNGFFPIPSTAHTVVTVVYLGLEGSMEGAQGTKLCHRGPLMGGLSLPSVYAHCSQSLPGLCPTCSSCLFLCFLHRRNGKQEPNWVCLGPFPGIFWGTGRGRKVGCAMPDLTSKFQEILRRKFWSGFWGPNPNVVFSCGVAGPCLPGGTMGVTG